MRYEFEEILKLFSTEKPDPEEIAKPDQEFVVSDTVDTIMSLLQPILQTLDIDEEGMKQCFLAYKWIIMQ